MYFLQKQKYGSLHDAFIVNINKKHLTNMKK